MKTPQQIKNEVGGFLSNFILHKDNYFYPINPPIENPFKNYKEAIKFLMRDINNKTFLTNYKPSNIDFALLTLFKSKRFKECIK